MLCIRGSKSTLKECWLELVVKISQYDKIAMNKFFWRVTQVRQTIQWKSKYYPAGIYLLKVNHSFVPALMPIRPRSHGRYIKENPLYVYKVRSIKTHNLPTLRAKTSFCIYALKREGSCTTKYLPGIWTSLYCIKLELGPVIALDKRGQEMTTSLWSHALFAIYGAETIFKQIHVIMLMTSSINFSCQRVSTPNISFNFTPCVRKVKI